MTDSTKRAVSIALFSLGSIIGFVGWAAIPTMTYAFGVDESRLATAVMTSCVILFPAVCIFAFWKRRASGVGLLLIALMWVGSIFVQYCFYEADYTTAGPPVCFLIVLFFAAFALMTERSGWPPMRNPRKSD